MRRCYTIENLYNFFIVMIHAVAGCLFPICAVIEGAFRAKIKVNCGDVDGTVLKYAQLQKFFLLDGVYLLTQDR